jgi:HPt (histidine-containing phosphotransfer) domain-containing protein
MGSSFQTDRRPVDLRHLSDQTAGDRILERQVLEMFITQIPQDITRLRNAGQGKPVSELAHRIVGASRALGAHEVAAAAASLEATGSADEGALADLDAAFEVARGFISHYLRN